MDARQELVPEVWFHYVLGHPEKPEVARHFAHEAETFFPRFRVCFLEAILSGGQSFRAIHRTSCVPTQDFSFPGECFPFLELGHRLVETFCAVKNVCQFGVTAITNVRMPRGGGDQVPKLAFGVHEFVFAAIQMGGEIACLLISGIELQTFDDHWPRFLNAIGTSQKPCQTELRVEIAGFNLCGLQVQRPGF